MVCIYFNIIFVGSLKLSCCRKYLARPGRKFRNSIRVVPGCKITNHKESLPEPFPIRAFLTLRVNGRWGKALNQKDLFVRSPFRELRFNNKVNRKILVLDKVKVR